MKSLHTNLILIRASSNLIPLDSKKCQTWKTFDTETLLIQKVFGLKPPKKVAITDNMGSKAFCPPPLLFRNVMWERVKQKVKVE